MTKFVKWGAFMLLCVATATNLTGCSDDHPDYENVTPPTVEVAPNTLGGIVTGINGDAIANATVTMSGAASATAQTDANGVYLFNDVKAGTYTLKAEATDKLTQEGSVTIENNGKSQNAVWNVTLPGNVKTEVNVSATEASSGDVSAEALKGNEKAEVKVEVTIPANAIDMTEGEDVKIEVSPIYSEGNASATRAESSTLLVGSALRCSKSGATLNKAIDLSFNVDEELATVAEAKQYQNGQWVTVESRVENGKVIIEADEFTSYGLFLGVSFTEKTGSEAISFAQDKWNNLYGSKEMPVESATYNYKVGTELATNGTTVLTALLIEKLAQRYGAKVATVNGSYPINVTLPIGTILTISGVQQKITVSASANGKSVSGTRYGTVTVVTETSNRRHSGGGSD